MRDWSIISVDDHLIEPPDTWTKRVSKRYLDRCPRVVESDVPSSAVDDKGFGPGNVGFAWEFDGVRFPFSGMQCCVGKEPDEWKRSIPTFDSLYDGCYDVHARVRDMDEAGMAASLCFPTMPGFGGTHLNSNPDRELSIECVRAYNDFVLDEWCGAAPGRFIPAIVVPYWDMDLATEEVLRTAERGARAIAFSERPHEQGYPSLYDEGRYWDRLFGVCQEAEVVLCCHIGSSSHVYSPPDSDYMTHASEVWLNAPYSVTEYIYSGTFERFPRLKVVYSEAAIGWMPFLFQTIDRYWESHAPWTDSPVKRLPSEHLGVNVFGCFIKDWFGAEMIERLGVDSIMVEVDYPHGDTIWPDVRKTIDSQIGHLSEADQLKIRFENAEKVFRFTPSKIGQP